jgi:hypothetical protein
MSAVANVLMRIKVNGKTIDGESTMTPLHSDKSLAHEGWIEIDDWSWEIRFEKAQGGKGSGAGTKGEPVPSRWHSAS